MAITPQYKTEEEIPEEMRDHYAPFARADGSKVYKLQVEGDGWEAANTTSMREDLEAQKKSVATLEQEKDTLTKQVAKAQKEAEDNKKIPGEREKELEIAANKNAQDRDAAQGSLDSLKLDHTLASGFVKRLMPDPADQNGKSDLLAPFGPLDILRATIRDRMTLERADDGTEKIVILTAPGGEPATRVGEDGITHVPITLDDLMDAAFEQDQFKKMLPSSVASPAQQPPRSGITGEPSITKTDAELVAQIGR